MNIKNINKNIHAQYKYTNLTDKEKIFIVRKSKQIKYK